MSIPEMVKKARCEAVKNQLENFIKDEKTHEICINEKYLITKHIYKDSAFLYLKNIWGNMETTLSQSYEYKGFYNFISNKFYDTGYPFSDLIGLKTVDTEELRQQIIKAVKEKIASELKNNSQKYFKEPFKVSEKSCDTLNNYLKYNAKESARMDFFNGKTKNLIDFIYLNFSENSENKIKEIGIDEILSFIQNPQTIINYYKEEFLNKDIQNLYVRFKSYEAYEKHFSEIENDKLNLIHKQKFLKEALKGKKTVNITIFKNDKEFKFKTGTSPFLRLSNEYCYYELGAKERKEYKELFGCKDYCFGEILEITYGKETIYSKKV